jgi:NitT/TauT family transport system permease protein
MIKQLAKKTKHLLKSSVAILIFLAIWEIAARLEVISKIFFPPLSKVAVTLWDMAITGELWKHLSVSLWRSLSGFLLGMAVAVPAGLIIGWFKKVETFLYPLLQVFRNMPTLALLPVFVLFFGIGEFSKTMVILWGVLWATLVNTIAGVRNVDPLLIKAARSMGVRDVRLFTTVVLPASMPYIFTGMRISATVSILILIAAEMMGASKGLGYALFFYQSNFYIAQMYAILIIMALLGVTLNYVLENVEKRSFRWRDNDNTSNA